MPPAKTLMIQGASSSVGKSLIVAGLCRIFSRRGLAVAPFKAQNMSNNAAVCPDGGEIGRAQALQALAAGAIPTPDMNPILLKPEAESRSQVIVHGKPWRTMVARDYFERKRELWDVITGSLDRLRTHYDLIIVEGAGSPVELNLKASDVVNMAVAKHLRAPVLLVGDIDRGGVFAQLLGTLQLFEPDERRLVKGLIVNRFRGDPTLFAEGVKILHERSQLPVLGVIPWLHDLGLPEEDAVSLERANERPTRGPRCSCGGAKGHAGPHERPLDVVVVRLPRIANFDDFDPLAVEPGVRVRFVESPDSLGRPDAVILPGTKSTIADLEWLRSRGLDLAVRAAAEAGASVVGICGGYQMLGHWVKDPGGFESSRLAVEGLGLLPGETTFQPVKATRLVKARILGGPGWLDRLSGQAVEGYEIHMGTTSTPTPWLAINGEAAGEIPDGAASRDGRVWGCYLHGLFANDSFRRAWLTSLQQHRVEREVEARRHDFYEGLSLPDEEFRTRVDPVIAGLDRLADALEQSLSMSEIAAIIDWGGDADHDHAP